MADRALTVVRRKSLFRSVAKIALTAEPGCLRKSAFAVPVGASVGYGKDPPGKNL